VVSEELVGLAPVHYAYDDQGRVSQVEQHGATTAFTYGKDGMLASVTDPLGHTERYEQDANGRTTAVVQADESRVEGEYSGSNAVRAITVPDRARHSFGIGPAGLIQSYTPPTREVFRYSYNPFLELESVKLPTNDQLQIAFERRTGRLLSLSHAASNVMFGYDGSKPLVQSLTSAEGILQFTYDGSVLTDSSLTGAVTGEVTRRYDENGWVQTQSVAGVEQLLSYDDDGLLVSVGREGLTRDAATGDVTKTTLRSFVDAYVRDKVGRVVSYRATFKSSELYAREDERDLLGRVVKRTEQTGTESHVLEYDYDERGRLVEVRRDGQSSESYRYDQNGNRTSALRDGQMLNARFGAADEMLSQGNLALTYDGVGNLTSDSQGHQYSYDAIGQLRRVMYRTARSSSM